MNHLAWIGVILWGLLVTVFGASAAVPVEAQAGAPAHDVVFLLAGGLLTCLIGIAGLGGFMGWMSDLRKEQKNSA